MTTVIIDGKTKAIYTDTRQTQVTSRRGNFMLFLFKVPHINKCTEYHLIDDAVKCFYISKEVGYITSTGDTHLFNECVSLSKKNNEFSLPDVSYGYSPVTIINVKLKDNGFLDVVTYKPKTNKRWFGEEYYWDNNWTMITEEGISFYGSGADYAEGAYRAGASPKEAIVAASKCDHYTNCNINIYDLTNNPE